MKKCLIVLTALTLAGCAHSQFRGEFLEQYASHDCIALDAEMSTAQLELQRLQMQRRSGISGPERRGVRVYNIEHFRPGDYIRPNERRMRSHARLQAILQLKDNQGCNNAGASAADDHLLTATAHHRARAAETRLR